MLQFYSASTANVNSRKAILECLEIALEGEPNLDCDLLIIHSSMGHNFRELLSEARRLAPSAQIGGCTGVGIIGSEGPNESMKALAIMAIKGPQTEFSIAGTGSLLQEDPVQQATEVAQVLRDRNPDIRQVYYLPPFGNYMPYQAIESIESVLGPEVSIFGGEAVDNGKNISCFGFLNDQVLERGTVMIGFADPTLQLYCQASHGMKVLKGTPYKVTRSRDNLILEFNGQPAWKLILSALGLPENASYIEAIVMAFLATKLPEEMQEAFGYKYHLNPIWGDPETGSLVSVIKFEDGMVFYLAKRDEELMFEGVDQLAYRITDHVKGKTPVAVFHADCQVRGRYTLNKDLKYEIVERMQSPIFGMKRIPWFGFYAGGEFSRIGGKNVFNGFTSTLSMLYRNNE
jgi:small ligand-binding sensory domain FIST